MDTASEPNQRMPLGMMNNTRNPPQMLLVYLHKPRMRNGTERAHVDDDGATAAVADAYLLSDSDAIGVSSSPTPTPLGP